MLGPAVAGLENRLRGTVQLVSYLGASIDVHVRVSPADRVVVSLPNRADGSLLKEGETTEVGWPADAAVVLAEESVRRDLIIAIQDAITGESNDDEAHTSAGAPPFRARQPWQASGLGRRSRPSRRPDKRIVLSTWGGDYAKLLTKHISVPLLAPKGWNVVNDEAQVTQRKAKVLAERRLPQGHVRCSGA